MQTAVIVRGAGDNQDSPAKEEDEPGAGFGTMHLSQSHACGKARSAFPGERLGGWRADVGLSLLPITETRVPGDQDSARVLA
jgi:hypothetical protein